MEYRSLFDTDTDTLLSEISSLEQQQQQQQNMYNQQQSQPPPQPQAHLMSNYSSQTPQGQQMLHPNGGGQFANTNHYTQQTQQHQIQPHIQQQQQPQYHNTPPSYSQIPTNNGNTNNSQQQQYYPNTTLVGNSNLKQNYMHSPMAPPPPPQPPPTNSNSNSTSNNNNLTTNTNVNSSSTNNSTLQNVQINVQNNFNLANKNIQQTSQGGAVGGNLNPYNPVSSNVISQQQQQQAPWSNMPNNPNNNNAYSSNLVPQAQGVSSQVFNKQQPPNANNLIMSPMQQQQQYKMNQFSSPKPSLSPQLTPQQPLQSGGGVVGVGGGGSAGSTPVYNSYNQQSQQQTGQLLNQANNQKTNSNPQSTPPPAQSPSSTNYSVPNSSTLPYQMNYNTTNNALQQQPPPILSMSASSLQQGAVTGIVTASSQAKLSSLPPHMQHQYPINGQQQQQVLNQNQNIRILSNTSQLPLQQQQGYQPSPNKLNYPSTNPSTASSTITTPNNVNNLNVPGNTTSNNGIGISNVNVNNSYYNPNNNNTSNTNSQYNNPQQYNPCFQQQQQYPAAPYNNQYNNANTNRLNYNSYNPDVNSTPTTNSIVNNNNNKTPDTPITSTEPTTTPTKTGRGKGKAKLAAAAAGVTTTSPDSNENKTTKGKRTPKNSKKGQEQTPEQQKSPTTNSAVPMNTMPIYGQQQLPNRPPSQGPPYIASSISPSPVTINRAPINMYNGLPQQPGSQIVNPTTLSASPASIIYNGAPTTAPQQYQSPSSMVVNNQMIPPNYSNSTTTPSTNTTMIHSNINVPSSMGIVNSQMIGQQQTMLPGQPINGKMVMVGGQQLPMSQQQQQPQQHQTNMYQMQQQQPPPINQYSNMNPTSFVQKTPGSVNTDDKSQLYGSTNNVSNQQQQQVPAQLNNNPTSNSQSQIPGVIGTNVPHTIPQQQQLHHQMPMQLNTVNQQATLNTNQNNNMMIITTHSPFAQNNPSINSQQQHSISHDPINNTVKNNLMPPQQQQQLQQITIQPGYASQAQTVSNLVMSPASNNQQPQQHQLIHQHPPQQQQIPVNAYNMSNQINTSYQSSIGHQQQQPLPHSQNQMQHSAYNDMPNNSTFPGLANTTMSFIDKQQQLINENLNTTNTQQNISLDSNATTAKQSPNKKLTKKQLLLQQQQAGELGDADLLLTSAKKAPGQRKIKPKKGSLDNSLSGDTSMINGDQAAGTDGEKCTLSATTQSKIEATIDDFMKQYKLKTKKKKKKDNKQTGNDENENPNNPDESESDNDNDIAGDDDSTDSDSSESEEELTSEELKMRKLDDKDLTFEGNNSILHGDGLGGSDGDTSLKKKKRGPKKQSGEKKPKKISNKMKKLLNTSDMLSQDDESMGIKSGLTTGEGDGTTAAESDNLAMKKKRRYTKKKSIASHLLDDKSMTLDGIGNDSNSGALNGEESQMMTPDIEFPAAFRPRGRGKTNTVDSGLGGGTPGSGRGGGRGGGPGRRKSVAHLVNFVKKNSRKKRKKTSSGEEEDADDDSDDFEFQCTPAQKLLAKKEIDAATAVSQASNDGTSKEAIGDTTGEPALSTDLDEAAAKLLQANEKRRSTRAVASKRQKCSNDTYVLKDEDLMMPVTAEELAADAAEADTAPTTNSNIVLDSNFIVDKILGFRLFKRKTKRKIEKPKKEKIKKEEIIMKEQDDKENKVDIIKKEDSIETQIKSSSEFKESTDKLKVEESVDAKKEPDQSDKIHEEKTTTEDLKSQQMDTSDITVNKDTATNLENNQPSETVILSANTDEKSEDSQTKIIVPEEPKLENPENIESNKTNDELVVKETENKIEINEENKMELESQKEETVKKEVTENTEETLEAKKEKEEDGEEDEEEEVSEYEEDGGEIEVEEFFVKYKNYSYLHCEWRTRDELFYSDKRVDQKIKRYKLKKSQTVNYDWDENENGYTNEDDELFNPDYVEVDRILDVYEMDDPAKPNTKLKYYLVKWKTLPYDESSWELEKDIKSPSKIEAFYKFNTLVPDVHARVVPKPRGDKWQAIPATREYKNGMRLREYQLEGINWLTFCWLNSRNCILADEMGLGKTVQSVTFLQEVAHYGIRGPFLVIVPLSTIGNWIREFERWTQFNVIMYHGSSASRQMLQDYEFYFTENGTTPEVSNSAANAPASSKKLAKFNALITTFEVILSDVPLFCEFKWRNVIIDEAHRLKNKNCKLIEGLRYIDVEHKVLLTGTPLQNNVEELFSLLNYLEPQQFHSSAEFMQDFGDLKTDTQVSNLQALLKPMMLRRLKEDVEKNLAPKEETIVEVELTNTQKKYYRAILEKNFQFLSRGASSSNVPNLMNTMMELRKCCNHPYLINGAEDQIIAEHSEKKNIKIDIKDARKHDKLILEAMVQASGKLVLVDKLLPKLKAGGHKVLIFSQMIRVLDILEDYLIQMRFGYERIDGRIRGELRQEAIDRYSKPDSDRFAFLLCTRAGGLGINLTAADTVIIYDSDWNPQNDLQAQARCHRIGQQKSVKIYRLITRNTYEREMFDKASLKLGLDKAILQSMRNEDKFNTQQNQNNFQLTKKEIEDLLKKGAYGAIMEDDTAADKFCEEDIDKILQHRSTVIQIEGGEKGSTFSKASFQSTDTNEISIDDPEFWQKWAKKADIDVEEKLNPKDERIIYEPRRRTQTRRFGGPDDMLESDYSSSDTDDENKDPNGKDANNPDGKASKDGKHGKHRGKKSKRGNKNSEFNPNGQNDNDADWNGGSNDAIYEDSGVWSRDECYKVEKNLLIFGWSRWGKILKHCEFSSRKKGGVQNEQDVENLSRTIIAFALKNYHGDESIKQFMIDLIDPSKSNFADLKNHHGLAAPVGRGKKSKNKNVNNNNITKIEEEKAETNNENLTETKSDEKSEENIKSKEDEVITEKKDEKLDKEAIKTETTENKKGEEEKQLKTEDEPTIENQNITDLEWAKNAEELLGDENYKKHLIRQANRILLRLRQLFYIKHEIIGDENATKIDEDDNNNNTEEGATESISNRLPDLQIPEVLQDLPAEWWDRSCDVSMFVGVYKHGYEKYSLMRLDPKLCFLQICGPPDAQDLLAEQQQQDEANDENNDAGLDAEEAAAAAPTAKPAKGKGRKSTAVSSNGYQKFPTVSELNNRLRRLIASVQKYKKQELLMSKRNAEREEKRMSKLASTQERAVMRQIEKQSKWSRREEQNFYRAISSFGVDCTDKANNVYAWDRFKEIGQLDKKLDETITDYFNSFYFMCKKVCHKLADDEQIPPPIADLVQVETISEERASRCIQRVELLNKVRHDVLKHEKFEEWMSDRCLPSADLPDWWIPCKHDRELVKAAAKYGINRTEYYYVNDPEYSFKDYLEKYMSHIEELMSLDNMGLDSAMQNLDPIQYYFQNQGKIQISFKQLLNKDETPTSKIEKDKDEIKEASKKEELIETKEETIDDKIKTDEQDELLNKTELEENDTSKNQLMIDESQNLTPKKPDESEEKSPKKIDEKSPKKEETPIEKSEEIMDIETNKETSAPEEKSNEEEKATVSSPKSLKDEPMIVDASINESELKDDIKLELSKKLDQSPSKAEKDSDDSAKIKSEKDVAKVEEKQDDLIDDNKKTFKTDTIPATNTITTKVSNYFSNGNGVPMIMWPKDRVIVNRLENIIQMFENNGEWPQRVVINPMNINSGLPPSNSFSISNLVGNGSMPPSAAALLAEQRKLMMSPMLLEAHTNNSSMDGMNENEMYDYENSNNGDSEYSNTPSSKYQKPKRGRPPKMDMPPQQLGLNISQQQPNDKLRHLVNNEKNSRNRNNASMAEIDDSDDQDYDDYTNEYNPRSNNKSTKKDDSNGNVKSGKFLEPGEICRPKSTRGQMKTGQNDENSMGEDDLAMNRRGGRKPLNQQLGKEFLDSSINDGTLNAADTAATTAALAALFMTPGQDPDERIAVFNVEDGTRLVGNKAPKRIDLPRWLLAHPNYLPDESEIFNMTLKNQQQQLENLNNDQRSRRKSLKQSHPSNAHNDHMETSSLEDDEQLPPPSISQSLSNQKLMQTNQNKNLNKPNESTTKTPQQIQNSNPNTNSSTGNSFNPNMPLILFNKLSNKKLSGQKVPNWKMLSAFLEKNEQIYIDPTCNELVRSKYGRGNIPEIVKSRMINISSSKTNMNKPPQVQQQRPQVNSHSPQPSSSSSSRSQINQNRNNSNKHGSNGGNSNHHNRLKNDDQQDQQQQAQFNPFELQGLTDLLSATAGGQFDINNPLAGFMAALAAQGGAGAAPFNAPAFNPFLIPPFGAAGAPNAGSGAPDLNFMADLLSKMPPGFDISAFGDLTASLTAAAAAEAANSIQSDSPPAQSHASSKQLGNNLNNKNRDKMIPSSNNNNTSNRDQKDKKSLSSQSQHQQQIGQPNKNNNHRSSGASSQSSESGSNNNKDRYGDIGKSNLNHSAKNLLSSSKPQLNQNNSIESKLNKDKNMISNNNNKRPSGSNNNNVNNDTQQTRSNSSQHGKVDKSSKGVHLEQYGDANEANALAAATSIMEQEKFMQDMMNLTQFAAGFGAPGGTPFNPFGFPAVPPPASSSSSKSSHKFHRGGRERSQSPSNINGLDRSISPASSVASNISQQQQPTPSADFSVFMNNLMNFGGAGGPVAGSPFAPPLPMPPILPGMAGDLSKLPVDLLAALTAAAAGQGGALDPTMFSALAQLNSLSNSVASEENHVKESHSSHSRQQHNNKTSTSSSSKLSSSSNSNNKQSMPHNLSKHNPSSLSTNPKMSSSSTSSSSSKSSSQQHSSSAFKQSSSSGNSSNLSNQKRPPSSSSSKPSQSSGNNDQEQVYNGLDLSIKKPSSSIMNKNLTRPSSSLMAEKSGGTSSSSNKFKPSK